jgi:hypothetical protein
MALAFLSVRRMKTRPADYDEKPGVTILGPGTPQASGVKHQNIVIGVRPTGVTR